MEPSTCEAVNFPGRLGNSGVELTAHQLTAFLVVFALGSIFVEVRKVHLCTPFATVPVIVDCIAHGEIVGTFGVAGREIRVQKFKHLTTTRVKFRGPVKGSLFLRWTPLAGLDR